MKESENAQHLMHKHFYFPFDTEDFLFSKFLSTAEISHNRSVRNTWQQKVLAEKLQVSMWHKREISEISKNKMGVSHNHHSSNRFWGKIERGASGFGKISFFLLQVFCHHQHGEWYRTAAVCISLLHPPPAAAGGRRTQQ